MKKTKFKLLNILLTLALAITIMPAFVQTAYAGTDVYTNLIPTGGEDAEALAAKQVTFNNKPWYIIADNSTSATAGSITLLVADTSFGTSTFGSNNTYVGSTVKGILDALTQSGGAFADVADAIINKTDNETDIGKLYLLSGSEASQVSENVRKLKYASTFDDHGKWWLRSPGSMSNIVSAVWGDTGGVAYDGGGVSTTQGVRPALELDLSKVTFDSTSKTFSLKPSHTHSFTYSASGATVTATCANTDGNCDLPEVEGKHVATLTINAPALTTYGGSESAEATITDQNNIKGDATVSYFKANEQGTDKTGDTLSAVPTDAGKYWTEITLGTEGNKATAHVVYSIAKANPTANAPTGLSATYGQTLGDIEITNPTGNTPGTWAWADPATTSVGNAGSNTFKANFTPEDTANYNNVSNVDVTIAVGKKAQTITADNITATYGDTGVKVNATADGDGKISYAIKSGSGEYIGVTTDTGVLSLIKAGTGTVVVTASETASYQAATKEVTVTINKAEPTVNAPKAKALTYTGEAQELVTEGSTSGKEMQYVSSADGSTAPTEGWSTTIPSETNTGTYYVWYKVVGGDNYNDVDPAVVTAKIDPVDKSSLNEPITKATELLDNISGKTKFSDIAATLNTAITTAEAVRDNDNQTEAQVAAAVNALNSAIDTAKAGVVSTIINNTLPAPEAMTTDDITDIETAKAVYDGLTDTQKALVDSNAKTKLEAAVEILPDLVAAKAVEDKIDALPTPDKVTANDETAIEEARKAYDALKPAQKDRISEDAYKKLLGDEAAVKSKIAYLPIQGAGSSWMKGSASGNVFIFKRNVNDTKTINQFNGIKVDGTEVATSKYSYKAGSVVINLNPSYLESLALGEHTLTAMFKDGNDVTVRFRIIPRPTPSDDKSYIPPKTGIE